ncbi:FadR/GntR family transcriptional regulator [Glaciecola sp. 1036]|uniref:FadR/GntR family transcriptional regulator n=1 Tax=Alteromonadaceae TaxID=72275 RepID=UPI003D07464D
MKLGQIQKSKSLTHELADTLRQEIIGGKYKIGDKLPSSKYIETQVGVSRTVVREALAQLRAEGLLESRQGSGVFVSEITPKASGFNIDHKDFADLKNAIHILELRMAVEVEMSGKAALNRSEQQLAQIEYCCNAMEQKFASGADAIAEDFAFHKAIADASGNPYFRRFIDFIGDGVIPAREIILNNDQELDKQAFIKIVQQEHQAIVDAIRAKDSEGAKSAIHAHLSNSIHRHQKIAQHIAAEVSAP